MFSKKGNKRKVESQSTSFIVKDKLGQMIGSKAFNSIEDGEKFVRVFYPSLWLRREYSIVSE